MAAELDKVHLASIYLATVIGSVTCTGSLVAFGKVRLKHGFTDKNTETPSVTVLPLINELAISIN